MGSSPGDFILPFLRAGWDYGRVHVQILHLKFLPLLHRCFPSEFTVVVQVKAPSPTYSKCAAVFTRPGEIKVPNSLFDPSLGFCISDRVDSGWLLAAANVATGRPVLFLSSMPLLIFVAVVP